MSLKYDTNHTTVYTIEVISNTFMEKISLKTLLSETYRNQRQYLKHTYIYTVCLSTSVYDQQWL